MESNLIEIWRQSAITHAYAREEYRSAYAKAYLESQQKTGDGRKYEADIATSRLRLARDEAEVIAAANWQAILMERGKLEGSANPQLKFGDD